MKSTYESLKARFEEFDRTNPRVWELFVLFTLDRIEAGFQNYSVNAIFERIRWETDVHTSDISRFKLNNNYRPFYARKFMDQFPEHTGFFRTRTQTSKAA